MAHDIMDEIITFNTECDKDLIDYFNEDGVSVYDLVAEFRSLLEEKENLERTIKEDYTPKSIDPYDEYGISRDDF